LHQYIGENMLVLPIGKELQTSSTNNHISWIFFLLAAPIYWWEMVSSTNVLVRYKGNLNIGSALSIQQATSTCEPKYRKVVLAAKKGKSLRPPRPSLHIFACR
jgi:hypothetical protein